MAPTTPLTTAYAQFAALRSALPTTTLTSFLTNLQYLTTASALIHPTLRPSSPAPFETDPRIVATITQITALADQSCHFSTTSSNYSAETQARQALEHRHAFIHNLHKESLAMLSALESAYLAYNDNIYTLHAVARSQLTTLATTSPSSLATIPKPTLEALTTLANHAEILEEDGCWIREDQLEKMQEGEFLREIKHFWRRWGNQDLVMGELDLQVVERVWEFVAGTDLVVDGVSLRVYLSEE